MWRDLMIHKVILAVSLLLGSQLAMAQGDKYQEGVHYFELDLVQAPADSDMVVVTEAFSYTCSHCNTLDPYVQNWKKTKPDNVKLNRIPVVFGNRTQEIMARAYIAAEMMGIVEESHIAMMDAIWKEKKRFRNLDQIADFYVGFGIDKDDFIANFNSFAADMRLRQDQRDVLQFGISATPSFIVNRKYRVPNITSVMDVIDFLIAKESAAP